MKRLTLYLLFALTCCLVTAAGERAFAQAKKPTQAEIIKQRLKEVQQKQNNAGTPNQPRIPVDPTVKQMFDSMSQEQKEQLAKMIMTVDPSSITELSALPGNTPEEKRMYLVRFLQMQGFDIPGAPPLEGAKPKANDPGQPQPNAPGQPKPANGAAPAVELLSDSAEEEEAKPLPLYQQEPFDEIKLTERFEHAVLKVQPLPFRTTPAKEDPIHKKPLPIRLTVEPETPYTLVWLAIEKFRFFEDMIADKAMELSSQGKFEESFVYIKFLMDEYPSCKQIDLALEQLYYDEAVHFIKEKKMDVGLARLFEIYDRYPKSAKAEKLMAGVVKRLTMEYWNAEDYVSARAMMDNLTSRYPKNATGLELRQMFVSACQKACDEATAAWQNNDKVTAALAGERMKQIWPSCEGVKNGKEILETLKTKYPAIQVGVTMPCTDCVNVAINDWASYRSRRLMYRLMTEFKGPGPEGGTYESPLGSVMIQDLGRRLTFELHDNLRWASRTGGDDLRLSGADIAAAALEMSNPQSETYSPAWASLFQSAGTTSPLSAAIQLNRPYVCPLALLQTPVLCYSSGLTGTETDAGANGPYLPADLPNQEKVGAKMKLYLFNENYFAAQERQPRMITEVYYGNGRQALKDLESGKIIALDRINPWEVPAAIDNKNIHAYPYSMPLVHCLVPNRSKLLLSNRTYRRALVYALNREGILRHLIGENERIGCRVVSGPFSPGIESGDALSYAYDVNIKPRPYNPHLAFVLTQSAMMQIDKAQKKQAEADAKKAGKPIPVQTPEPAEQPADQPQAQTPAAEPSQSDAAADSSQTGQKPDQKKKKKKDLFEQKFVLGYPPHETARIACQIIARQYKAIGIEVELYEFAPGEPVEMSDKIDLLYVELSMFEPIVDAQRILGDQGPSGKCSTHIAQGLRELDGATDWTLIGQTLRRLHQLSFDDTAVIPLWQIRDYFGVNPHLQGTIEAEDVYPTSLYERIEEWINNEEQPANK